MVGELDVILVLVNVKVGMMVVVVFTMVIIELVLTILDKLMLWHVCTVRLS